MVGVVQAWSASLLPTNPTCAIRPGSPLLFFHSSFYKNCRKSLPSKGREKQRCLSCILVVRKGQVGIRYPREPSQAEGRRFDGLATLLSKIVRTRLKHGSIATLLCGNKCCRPRVCTDDIGKGLTSYDISKRWALDRPRIIQLSRGMRERRGWDSKPCRGVSSCSMPFVSSSRVVPFRSY